MIIYTDGSNHDDTLAILAALHSNVPIDAIVITANGWGHMGPSLQIFNNLTHALGRSDIPIIMGALHAHRDYLENHEDGISPTGLMFGRAVPSKALVELDILQGLAPELTQYPISDPIYNENYMEEIIEVLKRTKNITILSLGGMTDVKYTIEWLIENDRRDDIKAVWQMSAGYYTYEGGESMPLIDRSHESNFNIYLDPDAAADCLRLIPDKMIWVEGGATARPYFTPQILEPITSRTPLAAKISHSLMSKILQNPTTGIPIDPVTRGMSVWDLTTFMIMIYPELIEEEVMVPVSINSDSSVSVNRDSTHTTVCYKYNNELATMTLDEENGYRTRIITKSYSDRVLELYRQLMLSPQGTRPLNNKSNTDKYNNSILLIISIVVFIAVVMYLMYLRNRVTQR